MFSILCDNFIILLFPSGVGITEMRKSYSFTEYRCQHTNSRNLQILPPARSLVLALVTIKQWNLSQIRWRVVTQRWAPKAMPQWTKSRNNPKFWFLSSISKCSTHETYILPSLNQRQQEQKSCKSFGRLKYESPLSNHWASPESSNQKEAFVFWKVEGLADWDLLKGLPKHLQSPTSPAQSAGSTVGTRTREWGQLVKESETLHTSAINFESENSCTTLALSIQIEANPNLPILMIHSYFQSFQFQGLQCFLPWKWLLEIVRSTYPATKLNQFGKRLYICWMVV